MVFFRFVSPVLHFIILIFPMKSVGGMVQESEKENPHIERERVGERKREEGGGVFFLVFPQ